MQNKQAFTLAELLIAMGVIGAIAALAVPNLFDNINNRLLISQLKNTVTMFQQLTMEQLVGHKTKDLNETAFESAETLFSSGNFDITRSCATPEECWKTKADSDDDSDSDTDTDTDADSDTDTDTDADADADNDKEEDPNMIIYKKLSDKTDADPAGTKRSSVILKNGVIMSYAKTNIDFDGDKFIGEVCFDVNGNDGPNFVGRDYFCFYVTKLGKIATTNDNLTEAQNAAKCQDGLANYCTKTIIESGWKIKY